jgi:gamma-glutamylputrescine oxidase
MSLPEEPTNDRPPSTTLLFRLKVFFGLLTGLRRHDFRAARTFANMNWPGAPGPKKFLCFVGWSLRQMWCDIPNAMHGVAFARPISKVPVWLKDGNPLADHPWRDRPDAALPAETDTVVIGSGLAGSAAAYHWSRRSVANRKLVVLEREDVASGSAGRNEGLVVMGRYYHMVYKTVLGHLPQARPDLSTADQDQLAKQFAAAYCRGCYRNGDLIEKTIREEGFACHYAREGWVQAVPADGQANLSESVQMALDSGFDDWASINPQRVRELCGMRVRHNAAFSIAAASFHPAKWCWSLVGRALESESVELYARTAVRRVEDAGDHYLVRTDRGDVKARHVINCTESYTAMLHPQFSGHMRPTQTQAATGSGGPEAMKPHVGISGPRGFFGRHGETVMVGTDSTRVPDHEAGRIQPSRFLTKFCIAELRSFYGPFDYQVANEWSGTVTYTPDEYPVVGLMDRKRQYIIGGMAGSGTSVGFNGARCIVNRILGHTDEPDDFPPEYFSPMRLLDPEHHAWPKICSENGA